jgi:CDP-diacylglycerol--serine O-phosphatidyltransferase
MTLRERLVDPRSPDRRPRRAAYVLPTLFTAGNVFLGFVAILQAFQGAMAIIQSRDFGHNDHFETAAKMIGLAIFTDGLDGRIARMTNTTSDFGREMDSLADVISFGLAPAVLAYCWGVQFIDYPSQVFQADALFRIGYFFCFLFLMCGASRLARFNITTNPIPKNPGRPDRKYFVGLPIPAGAGIIAAIIYASGSAPLRWWPLTTAWLALIGLISFLMVSTWRYPSFKGINLGRPRSPLTIIVVAAFIFLIYIASHVVLLALGVIYVGSGIAIRLGGLARRHLRARQVDVA